MAPTNLPIALPKCFYRVQIENEVVIVFCSFRGWQFLQKRRRQTACERFFYYRIIIYSRVGNLGCEVVYFHCLYGVDL